jgi:hypothetical protein
MKLAEPLIVTCRGRCHTCVCCNLGSAEHQSITGTSCFVLLHVLRGMYVVRVKHHALSSQTFHQTHLRL